ncbi:MAG: flagellar filament capping protein FliD [Thermaerobacter sp.]|nr:flagellar filament capping protein FliD [Thermaerobacter sp.]
MSGIAINWQGIYGQNNVAAQMLSDFPLTTMESLAIQPLTWQLNQLQQQISTLNQNQQAWQTLQHDAQAFYTALSGLGSGTALQNMSATSNNPSVATAAADGNSPPGTYTMSVQRLAANEIDGTASTAISITSATTALGLATATIGITIGSATYDVGVNSSTTLDGLVTELTQSGAPLVASVGQSGTAYYLQLWGTQTDQTFQYVSGSTALADVGILTSTASGYSVNVVQHATTSSVLFQGATVTNPTNTVTNVIPNVTLNLAGVGSTAITITPNYTADSSSVQQVFQDWQQWVSDTYNLAFGTLPQASTASGGQTSFPSNPNQVIHSPVPMAEMNQLASAMTQYVDPATGYSLGSLGVAFDSSTQNFTVNSSTLTAALQTNLAGVQQFFQQLASTALGPMVNAFGAASNSTTAEVQTQDSNQLNYVQQQQTLVQDEIQQALQNARSQYSAFVKTLNQLAQVQSLFAANLNVSNSNNGGSGGTLL